MNNEVEKVIVTVHGVGDQTRFATLQQTVSQFCQYHGEVAAVPLGNFHTVGTLPATSPGTLPGTPPPMPALVLSAPYPSELRKFAFAEVYWADIARKVAEEKYTLEDVAPWVRTIVSRVRMNDLSSQKLTADDQRRIEQVLGEMLQTISVLERLCFLADKLGLFSFDLKKVLVDYADDVQIVAEFRDEGQRIGKVFAGRMEAIAEEFPKAEIYLVAHSEGTVVSLLGLLNSICHPEGSKWIRNVRGFMTFGSPIDKHLILWPELFQGFSCPGGPRDKPIEWRNYYDFGDPVGFDLDTAREKFVEPPGWQGIFDFSADHDHGFARYPLPGKAHVDYWKDPEVFGHFIQQVVYKEEKVKPKPLGKSYAEPPASKTLSRAISWAGPYVGGLVLLFCAVLVLYNAAYGAIRPSGSPTEQAAVAIRGTLDEDPIKTFPSVAAITCLLAGLTVAARIPRLTNLRRWHLLGFAVFLLSIFANRLITCASDVSGWRTCLIDKTIEGAFGFSMAGIAIVVLATVYLVSRLKPAWGTRALLVPGGLAVAYVLYHHIKVQLEAMTNARFELHHLWPLLIAAAVFLYLWWLVALLFDLVFVWHRYIRYAGEGQYLSLPSSREAWRQQRRGSGGTILTTFRTNS